MTVRADDIRHDSPVASHSADVTFLSQTKTYDSVTDKFMDFSFEKVTASSTPLFDRPCRGNDGLMTYWCHLQTHSAYMLFYKRVEPEEENGKDFSFDVSPDLLEVRWPRPLKAHSATVTVWCYSSVCASVSVDLARQHAVPPRQEHL